MRHAASLVLALTALVLLPTASALSASAAAGAEVAVDPTELAPVTDLVHDVESGDITLEVPGVTAKANVAAGASVEPVDADGGPPTQVTPSTSTQSPIDPVVAAAVAAPLAVIAIGAAGGFGVRAALGNVAGWTVRALRAVLGLASFGLFSRIERGDLLDNPVRARVHDAIVQEPGLTISDVQARAGIAWGTTVHHLRRLEAHGLLVSTPQGGHRRYFIANTPAAAQRMALAALMQPTAHRIATLVAAQPGIDQSVLCQTLGLNGPSASKHLGHFRGQGLVESQRIGRRTVHRPTQGLLAALGMVGHAPIAWGSQSPTYASAAPVLVAAH